MVVRSLGLVLGKLIVVLLLLRILCFGVIEDAIVRF